MLKHTIQQGECISSVAFRYGFFPDTLWNHPENAALKRLREDPNVLLEGDVVTVPDLDAGGVDAACEQRHRFRRKGVPEKLRLRIEDDAGAPVPNAPYTLTVDGVTRRGTTDGGGWVIESIPPDARAGTLLVGKPGEEQEHALELGRLDPITEISGVQARLRNLGYDCEVTGRFDERTSGAVRKFQGDCALPVSGGVDDATRQEIKDRHRS